MLNSETYPLDRILSRSTAELLR